MSANFAFTPQLAFENMSVKGTRNPKSEAGIKSQILTQKVLVIPRNCHVMRLLDKARKNYDTHAYGKLLVACETKQLQNGVIKAKLKMKIGVSISLPVYQCLMTSKLHFV